MAEQRFRIGQTRTLAAHIAGKVEARANSVLADNLLWRDRHEDAIREAVSELPHGNGIDGDTVLDFDASKPDRLVIGLSFHHMDEHGGYDGWTNHQLIVTPSLAHGLSLRVTGRDRNEIKGYLAEIMTDALSREYTECYHIEDERTVFCSPDIAPTLNDEVTVFDGVPVTTNPPVMRMKGKLK